MLSIFSVTLGFCAAHFWGQRVIHGRSGNTAIDMLTAPPDGAAAAAGAAVGVAAAAGAAAAVVAVGAAAAGAVVGAAAAGAVVGWAAGACPPPHAARTGVTSVKSPSVASMRRRVTIGRATETTSSECASSANDERDSRLFKPYHLPPPDSDLHADPL